MPAPGPDCEAAAGRASGLWCRAGRAERRRGGTTCAEPGDAGGAPGVVALLAGSHCSVGAADSPFFPAHPRVSGLPGYSVTDSRSNTNLLEVYLLALIQTLCKTSRKIDV